MNRKELEKLACEVLCLQLGAEARNDGKQGGPGRVTLPAPSGPLKRARARTAFDKLECPETTITFLGITIDTILQQLRLPPDKLQEMTLLIKSWLGKHKTTKRDLLSLIGKLSLAAKVVPSSRLFLRQLIELSTTVATSHSP
ncbi:hypothetical protein EMCRGX_G005061 [Ephydatia muelleri]